MRKSQTYLQNGTVHFTIGWFRLDPALSGLDLRAAFYVSRDYMPIIHSEKSLSKEGSEVLAALLAVRTSVPAALSAKLNTLSSNEKAAYSIQTSYSSQTTSEVGHTRYLARHDRSRHGG